MHDHKDIKYSVILCMDNSIQIDISTKVEPEGLMIANRMQSGSKNTHVEGI